MTYNRYILDLSETDPRQRHNMIQMQMAMIHQAEAKMTQVIPRIECVIDPLTRRCRVCGKDEITLDYDKASNHFGESHG